MPYTVCRSYFFGTVTNKSSLTVENEHFWLLQGPYFVWQLPMVTIPLCMCTVG